MSKVRPFDQVTFYKADIGKMPALHIREGSTSAADYSDLMVRILRQSQCQIGSDETGSTE